MTVLIVGGDSRIGHAAADALRARGVEVLSSTRHPGQAGRPRIDLADLPAGWTPPPGARTAILCAARTSQQDCQANPDETRAVNVEGTLRIGEALAEAGVFTLFLSTSLVFDGTRPNMPGDSPYRPIGAYGAQKAEAERGLRALFPPDRLAVARLSKVLDAGSPLLRGWRAALDAGQAISPFDDVLIAPISLSFAAEAVARLAQAGIGGTFQFSAAEEVSYAALARALALRWGAAESLIDPRPGRTGNAVMRDAPLHGSLDAARAESLLGLTPPTAARTIEDLA